MPASKARNTVGFIFGERSLIIETCGLKKVSAGRRRWLRAEPEKARGETLEEKFGAVASSSIVGVMGEFDRKHAFQKFQGLRAIRFGNP